MPGNSGFILARPHTHIDGNNASTGFARAAFNRAMPAGMMAFWYLLLAMFLAVTLNQSNRFVRALGTAVGSLSLVMMVSSIILADFDGTFAHMPAQTDLVGRSKPLILNIQAAVGTAALVFLLWAAWRQVLRPRVLPLPVFNSTSAFGLVSRYAHWMTAVMMLALIPMGTFMSILPASSPDRASFVSAHQTMGLLVLILVMLRMGWLLRSPPPDTASGLRFWERDLARGVHFTLYGLILAFPVTGLFETLCRGQTVRFFSRAIPHFCGQNQALAASLTILHDTILPGLFYVMIFAHLGAVLKHHFLDRRISDVRRMLR